MTSLTLMRPKKPKTDNVRIDHGIAKKARMNAAARDMSLPDYLNQLLAELVEKDLQETIRDVSGRRTRRASDN